MYNVTASGMGNNGSFAGRIHVRGLGHATTDAEAVAAFMAAGFVLPRNAPSINWSNTMTLTKWTAAGGREVLATRNAS